MKLLGGYQINFEKDQIISKEGEVLGSFSVFKDWATDTHPDIVEKHRIKSRLVKTKDGIRVHKIVNWVEVIEEIL